MNPGQEKLGQLFDSSYDLFQNLPQGVAILGVDASIHAANNRFCEIVGMDREDILGHPLIDALKGWRLAAHYGREQGVETLARFVGNLGLDKDTSLILHDTPAQEKIYRFTIRRLRLGEEEDLILTLDEATEAHKREQKIRLLQRLAKHVRATDNLNHLLFTILTCVTAGRALSFSRAFIFLPTRGGQRLRCRMAMGPGSQEEAWRIWSEVAQEDPDLNTMITRFDQEAVRKEMANNFGDLMRIALKVDRDAGLVGQAFRDQMPTWTRNAFEDQREDPKFIGCYKASEFVAVPMIAGGKSLGVITADNCYRDRPIAPEDIEFLVILAGQAALALENSFTQATLRAQVKHLARINSKLGEARSKLITSEKMAAVGSVAARITHEIRNPLTTIGGFARMIQRQSAKGEIFHRNAGIIVEEVVRMEKLLQGILDYSRPSEVRPGPIDLKEILRGVLYTFSGRPESSQIKVEQLYPARTTDAWADPDHVRQILINLLKNAFEASTPPARITVEIDDQEDMRTLTITDEGQGMDEETQARLFDPFFTTKISGTGLGLSITKALVQANRGALKVTSAPGRGSSFTLALPTGPPAPEE